MVIHIKKQTWLWGEFNPPRRKRVKPTMQSIMHLKYGGCTDHTKTMRSITPPGFAQKFFEANQ